MAFDTNDLNVDNTPMRWRIVGKEMIESGKSFDSLDPNYKAALEKAATFAGDIETGTGNQPGVGSEHDPIRLTSIALSGAAAQDIVEGADLQLTVVFTPATADNRVVVFESSDEDVATVDRTGKVTAVGIVGETADVSVTSEDGNFTDTVTLTIIA